MCVQRGMFPLVKLETGKRKVLLNYGVIMENRDFESLDSLELSWRQALKGNSIRENFNYAVKKYGVVDFEKFVNVPCGHCEECLKSKARGWAFRILQEAKKYDNNFFLTFTYDDSFLPLAKIDYGFINTLVSDEISKFNKKLKTYLKRKGLHSDFRFYGVGEYGGKTLRPHYHVIYFNLDIPDLEFNYYKNGFLHFKSEFLNDCWSKGLVDIGAVDIGSACYVARYCDKKQDRDYQQKLLLKENNIVAEFSVMSRRPGIGSDALDKIIENVKNGIYKVSTNGTDFSIPIYYSKKVKEVLKDTPYLEQYEHVNDLLIRNRIANDISASDLLGDRDYQVFLLEEDRYKKHLKKQRVQV